MATDRPRPERTLRADWHRKAFVDHCGRVPDDFPNPRSEAWWLFFEPWSDALSEQAVTLREFEAASKRVAADPPFDAKGHLKAILARVARIRAEGLPVDHDRASAELASRDCPECDGQGITSRDHERAGYGRITVLYYCHRCPMGRWLKQAHAKDPKGVRLQDLLDHPELQRHPDDDQADPRHLEIAEWFAARKRAILDGTPLPPTPEVVKEIERERRRRNAPIPGKHAPLPRTQGGTAGASS